ncbi:HNH endonuclease [cf. Phormidesmis sp. LEGE 11477]|uniref:HNH endonuclease n=1 Tax=cf. Phormidesmis sp. LEGE 11477 TaxID=1828680 RepID=UPI0018824E6F|nr:HNH endonuclease signature motif containing protein [cf. Phormidesmis sp. LEGE 11477]MBE9061042.1 HNH endonuclease [cf. Phormidesmis sp. LEGE 11477]
MSRYISVDLSQRIRVSAQNRCGYCLSPQRLVMARLEIEHIVPLAEGGTNDESNLWLACPLCNGHKSRKIKAVDPETEKTAPLFNPRTQLWCEHFRWSDDGTRVVGITPIGRATVAALCLDSDSDAIEVRRYWIEAGWHPPEAL